MDETNIAQELYEALQNKIVRFTFKNSLTGYGRTAVGTLSQSVVPQPTNDEAKRSVTPNPEVIKYYDLERNDWRSVRRDSVEFIHEAIDVSIWDDMTDEQRWYI